MEFNPIPRARSAIRKSSTIVLVTLFSTATWAPFQEPLELQQVRGVSRAGVRVIAPKLT